MTRKTIDDLLAESRARLERLSPEGALAAQRAGALVIDTRSHEERRTGVIPGSLHVPLSVLPWRLDPESDPDFRSPYVEGLEQHIVLVCAHGHSSSLAAAMLQDLGFTRATDLDGGIAAWAEQGLPLGPAREVDPGATPGLGPPDD